MEFEKKRILITGASSGIGKETAIRMDKLGAEIIMIARNKKRLSELQNQLQQPCRCFSYDLSDMENIHNLFEEITKHGKLDGFIHCAGICKITPVKALELEELLQQMNVNAFSFFQIARFFSNAKYSNKSSSIVALSSIAAYTAEAGMCAYTMSKATLNAEIRVMAKEFIKRGIRVNAIMPAQVMSKMGEENNVWEQEELQDVKSYQPLGAIPISQIVNSIEFLMSNERAGYITGECLAITGGYKK